MARKLFDDDSLIEWGFVDRWPPAVEEAKDELADLQVVVFALADALAESSGEDFDVIQAALDKARGDVERGVRG